MGELKQKPLPLYSVEEVEKHRSRQDCWVIIEGKVYDLTKWAPHHPGGRMIINDQGGEDATDSFIAFHPSPEKQRVLMDKYLIGTVEVDKTPAIMKDFRELRESLVKKGLFEPDTSFYINHFIGVILFELVAIYIAYSTGLSTWTGFLSCALFLSIAQAQAGWLQHDFGHLAAIKSTTSEGMKRNKWWHYVIISGLKGASSKWWRFRHNRHHAKPNTIGKDPDVTNEPLFVFGENMIKEGRDSSLTPYQSFYWWIFGPPFVTTVFFFLLMIYYLVRHREQLDASWVFGYLIRFGATYRILSGSWQTTIGLYFAMRLTESMWFTWITSMSHLPMDIRSDIYDDWVHKQLRTTQNVEASAFNDWFTGHLNYQIEHHLFPLMPRHHYAAATEDVQAFLKKHNVEYRSKSLGAACWDVVVALQVATAASLSYGKNSIKGKKVE